MRKMIGCCGLDCEICDAYLATMHNDDALREKTAKLWGELNGVSIAPEMINCTGCRADGVKTWFCSNMCEIRKCAQDRDCKTCGECPELEGCKTVGELHKDNEEALENLK